MPLLARDALVCWNVDVYVDEWSVNGTRVHGKKQLWTVE